MENSLDVERCDTRIRQRVVELRVELRRLGHVALQRGADDGVGDARPQRDATLAPEVRRLRLLLRSRGRVALANRLHLLDVLDVLAGVGPGGRRDVELRYVSDAAEEPDSGGLRGVGERVSAGSGLVDSRGRKLDDVVDEVVDAVVGTSDEDCLCGLLSNLFSSSAVRRVRRDANGAQDLLQGSIRGSVVPSAVEDPVESIVSRVGDG